MEWKKEVPTGHFLPRGRKVLGGKRKKRHTTKRKETGAVRVRKGKKKKGWEKAMSRLRKKSCQRVEGGETSSPMGRGKKKNAPGGEVLLYSNPEMGVKKTLRMPPLEPLLLSPENRPCKKGGQTKEDSTGSFLGGGGEKRGNVMHFDGRTSSSLKEGGGGKPSNDQSGKGRPRRERGKHRTFVDEQRVGKLLSQERCERGNSGKSLICKRGNLPFYRGREPWSPRRVLCAWWKGGEESRGGTFLPVRNGELRGQALVLKVDQRIKVH